MSVSREVLRRALAQASHDTYERHSREMGRDESEIKKGIQDHDWDRADDAIRALVELGVWSDPDTPDDEPADPFREGLPTSMTRT
jgi:hypothetical protein